jgi:hypothetical protein
MAASRTIVYGNPGGAIQVFKTITGFNPPMGANIVFLKNLKHWLKVNPAFRAVNRRRL